MKKRIFTAFIGGIALLGCATTALPPAATVPEKAAAVCSDLNAAVLGAQIGLTAWQSWNWKYDYSQAQMTLMAADTLIRTSCAAAKTETELVQVRDTVMRALADAQKQQSSAPKWSTK